VAKNDVTVTMSAQDAGFVTKWLAAQRAVQGVDTAFTKLGQSGQTAGRRAGNAFNRIGGEFQRAALAIVGVGSALQAVATFSSLVRKEVELIRQRNREAGDFQVRFATAMIATQNAQGTLAGEYRTLTPGQLEARIVQGSRETRIDPTVVAQATTSALLTGGKATDIQSLEAVVSSMKMRPDLADDPEQLQGLVAGVLETQKRFDVSSDVAAANLTMLSRASSTIKLGDLATKIVPAISQLQGFSTDEAGEKDSFKFLASLLAGIGQRNVDLFGRLTATGGLNLGQQLQQATISENMRGTVQEQVEFLMGNREARMRFAGGLSVGHATAEELTEEGTLTGRARVIIGLRESVTPGSETRSEIDAAYGKMGNMVQADADAVQAHREEFMSLPSMTAFRLERESKMLGIGQQLFVDTGVRGASSKVFEAMKSIEGTSAVGSWARQLKFDIGNVGESENVVLDRLIDAVTKRQQALRAPTGMSSAAADVGFAEPATPRALKAADALDEIVNQLVLLREDMATGENKIRIIGNDTADESAPGRPPLDGMER